MSIQSKSYDNVMVVSPQGRIDHSNSDLFRHDLAPFVARCQAGGEKLVLDLGAVDYLSSAGLRCFMLAEKQAKSQGGEIVVAAMQPVVKEIFEISRFTLVFETFASAREAVGRFSAEALQAFDRARVS